MKSSTWKAVLVLAAIAFAIAMLVFGLLIPAAAAIILLLVLGGGALLNRVAGPPA